MSDKIRKQTVDTQLEFVEWLKKEGMYNPYLAAPIMQAMYNVWEKMIVPVHETVSEWEERAGEEWDNENAVYYKADGGCWTIMSHRLAKMLQPEESGIILVATHHGKPEVKA